MLNVLCKLTACRSFSRSFFLFANNLTFLQIILAVMLMKVKRGLAHLACYFNVTLSNQNSSIYFAITFITYYAIFHRFAIDPCLRAKNKNMKF